jgi:hypothetical protein
VLRTPTAFSQSPTPITIDARFTSSAMRPVDPSLRISGTPPAPVRVAAERVPFGYILLSVLFLAIAVAGFGAWLVLAVI